jgi:hypothetical protein
MRKASQDGYTSSCKLCLKARDAARYTKEREFRSLRRKEYMATTEGKDAHSRATTAWKEKNAVRRAAHVILGNAVKNGRVMKHPCWVCGEAAEAHHPDYSRPLDVVWLCSAHHKQAHALVKNIE